MKQHASRRRASTPILFAASALLTIFGNETASAANLTWDITPGTVGTGDGTITDGAGTWDNTTGNFTVDGGANNIAWSNTTNANDTAVFGGSYNSTLGTAVTGGNVAVASTGITLGSIYLAGYTSPNYNIGGGTLTFAPTTGSILLNTVGFFPNLTITSPIAGNALSIGTTSTGRYGYLVLNGSNTYTGGTTISNYIQITAGNSSAFGTGAVSIGPGFGLVASANITLANNFLLGSNSLSLTANNYITMSGALTGTGGFSKSGAYDLTLSGNNSGYSGNITLYGGTLRVLNSNTALGTGTFIAASGTTNASTNVTLATASGSSAITLANNIAINNNGTGLTTLGLDGGYAPITINGIISGNGYLVKASTGSVILNASNTYTGGTNISAGYLSVGNGNALGTGTLTVANGAQSASGVSSGNTPFFNVSNTSAVTIPNNIVLPTPASALVYTLQKNSASSSTGTNLLLSGNISGGNSNFTLELNASTSGDGTTSFELSGTNTGLTGTVRVNRGAIILDNANAIGTSSLYAQTNANSTIGNIDLNGSFTFANPITINTAVDSIGVSGSNSATISGLFTTAVAWSKVGTGTLTLAGTNAISGPTTIAGGTLVLGVAIPSTSALSIGSTGTNGGSILNVSSGIATQQTFASTTFLAGQSTFYNPSSSPLVLNAITRNTGATVDFGSTSTGSGVTTTTANTNGILGGYATTDGGASFATVTSGTGLITASTGTTTSVLGGASANYASGVINVDVNSSPTLDAGITVNSLRFIGTAANTLTLTGTNTIASGGILNAMAVGANISNISGGTITGPSAGGDLIVEQYDNVTGSGLTIASVIANGSSGATSLVKVGPGNLTLSGSNTYGGATTINAGTLTLVATAATPGTPSFTINNGGTLVLSGTNALAFTGGKAALFINSGGTVTTATAGAFTNLANTITMTGGTLTSGVSSSTIQYAVQGAGITATSDANGTAAVIGNGVGIYATATPINVAVGTRAPAVDVNVTGPILAGSATAGLVKTGNGILELSAANKFTGPTNVSAGTLITNVGNVSVSALGLSSSILISSGATIVANGDNSLIGYGANNVPITVNSGAILTNTGSSSNHLGGLLTLAGGTLATPGTNTSVYGSWDPDRGILATANSTISASNVVPGQVGGTFFNVASGVTLTVTGTLTHPASFPDTGINKIGLGTLTLGGYNTYNASAGTNVSAGTLVLSVGGSTGDIRGLLIIGNGGTVSATAADALGYSSGVSVSTLAVNAGGLFDIASTGNNGYITNLNLSGGTVTSSGGGAFNFNTGYNISSTGSTTPSLISAPIVIRGTGLNVITAVGVTSGPDLTISGAISSGSGPFNKSGAGNLFVSGSNSYAGGTIVTAGTLTFAGINAYPAHTNLTVATGASAIASVLTTKTALQVATLNISGGTLDLNNNGLTVHATQSTNTLGDVTALVTTGFHGGSWNGTGGIVSTSAASDTTHLTALGVILNDNGLSTSTPLYGVGGVQTTFNGVTPVDGDILVKYTYYGDTNLDGKVDATDYSRIDSAFLADQSNPTAYTGWYNGDFNYDGVINGSDYTLIDNAFNTQGASLALIVATPTAQIAGTSGTSAVPEPASLTLLGIGAASLLGRRRASGDRRRTR